ncbi:prenyltransferase/squalene oxidase repeat-containing protein [Conexibacter arvalis]|uniref:Putative membrane protein YgcG n=1 Tax=Conexibacter arvalis TaxID=912552 RepID=A0A840IF37_9ACTN|nr:prenyltransferase/squalene oxidase repeat-containing protein [Conexibacter arvalis]MBB4663439.1 putative membrane protein YgcG [Conexibacter arvalis]
MRPGRRGVGSWRRGSPRRRIRRRVSLAAVAAGLTLLSAAALGLTLSSAAAPSADDGSLDRMVRYLQQVQRRDGCFPMRRGGPPDPAYASSWAAIALAAAGVNPREQFRPDGHRSVLQCIRGAVRDLRVTTDYERVLLVVNAAGGADPRSFGGVDLVRRILDRQRPDGSFTHDPAKPAPGVNTTIWAVLSLAGARGPVVDRAIARAARWILSVQAEDGGWPAVAAGMASSTDMTGAALQALRAAGRLGGAREDRAAARARDRALAWLRRVQLPGGGFPDLEGKTIGNSASTAWVAQGLWAVGKHPGRWRRGGASMLDFLASLQRPDGSIAWTAADSSNEVWMTAYTAPAYSGRYLPLARVPFAGSVPDPRNRPTRGEGGDGAGGGSGGSGGDGGGVLIGGGGEGAPLFSRPRQGSKGSTVGGVTSVEAERGRPERRRERTQREQDEDPLRSAAGDGTDDDGGAPPAASDRAVSGPDAEPADAASGPAASGGADQGAVADAADRRARDGDAAADRRVLGAGGDTVIGGASGSGADDEQISGVVVGGVGGDDRTTDVGAAFGLRGASTGGDAGPWPAVAIAGSLLLAGGLGGLLERRRPDPDPDLDPERTR